MVNVDHEVIIMIIQETSFCHRNKTIVSQCQKLPTRNMIIFVFLLQRACVMCHLLPVTCHVKLTQTATATDPPPANSPTMHGRVIHKHPKILT